MMGAPSILPAAQATDGKRAAATPVGAGRWPLVARAILWGGLLAGAMDITDALVFQWARGGVPVRVLYYIASGVIGREAAYAGGWPAAALGLLLHFSIAYTATAVYVLASLRLRALARHPIVLGPTYGLAVMCVMQYIVLPLAGFRGGLRIGLPLVNLVLAHLFCVGLPIGLAARRAHDRIGES